MKLNLNLNHFYFFMITITILFMIFFPESAFAQVAFESKVKNLTNQLISVVLPLMSVLGLVYAVFMAMTGDASAKGRIIFVIGCSAVGFLAPTIINWLQSAAG